jgi:hypothetical protein
MREITEKEFRKPLYGFLFGNGMLLTPDEMKTVEKYGFLFNNGMILTPKETKIMESVKFIHSELKI